MAETLLVGAGIVLLALAVVGGLAGRVGQSVIPAYILVGVLLGPFAPQIGGVSLSVLPSPEPLRLLAELGVVLLLFFVGLELSLDQLVTNRRKFLAAGAIDIGISGPLGLLLGLAVGFSLVESLFLALIVFNSSTVIIAKSLLETGGRQPRGRRHPRRRRHRGRGDGACLRVAVDGRVGRRRHRTGCPGRRLRLRPVRYERLKQRLAAVRCRARRKHRRRGSTPCSGHRG